MKSKIFRTSYRNYVIAYNPKPGDSSIAPDYDFFRDDSIDTENNIIWSAQTVENCKSVIDSFEDAKLGVLQIEMMNGTVEEIEVKHFADGFHEGDWEEDVVQEWPGLDAINKEWV